MAEDARPSKNKSRRGGLEGTGVPLPINLNGNLVSAHNDSEFSSLIQQNPKRPMAEDARPSKNKSRRGGLEGTGVPLPINLNGNLVSAHNDSEFSSLIQQNPKRPAVVSYGACWCYICKQLLPTLCNLSNDHPSTSFINADIDECPEEAKDIRYTPTFSFYQNGEKVDEFYGAGDQRLRDRVWLHS